MAVDPERYDDDSLMLEASGIGWIGLVARHCVADCARVTVLRVRGLSRRATFRGNEGSFGRAWSVAVNDGRRVVRGVGHRLSVEAITRRGATMLSGGGCVVRALSYAMRRPWL